MDSKIDLRAILEQAVEQGASDIHFKVGQPPVIRFDGELGPLAGSLSGVRTAPLFPRKQSGQ